MTESTSIIESEAPIITSSDTVSMAAENQTNVIDVESVDNNDSEGAGLTYTFTTDSGGGIDNALFSIDVDTGVVMFINAPDFETPEDDGEDNIYNIQVTVTDLDTLTDVQDIAVTVTDANDAPEITSSNTANAAENQTDAIDVQSTDDTHSEGSGLIYSFTSTDVGPGIDNEDFDLAADGVITFAASPDFEIPIDNDTDNDYHIQVTVTDAVTPLTDVQNIVISVTNVVEAVVPTAVADSYTATGNVSLTVPVADGVILGTGTDNNGGGTITVTEVQGDVAKVGVATDTDKPGFNSVKGSITLAADGSFTYEPPPGFIGNDTFTYKIANSVGSDTATVTITTADMIWFIDNSLTADSNGTLKFPFTSITDFNTANTGSAPGAQNGHNIFIDTGSTSYTTGITLLTNQILIGKAAGDTIENITGLTLPSFSDSLPATGGTEPILTTTGSNNAINLANNNTIRGLDVGNTGNTGMNGTEVGTLFVREVGISGNGGGVDLRSTSGSAIDVVLDSLSASSITDEGVLLNNVSGSFSITATNGIIDNMGVPAVNITGATNPNEIALSTMTFQSISANGGTLGINLTNITGTFSVSGIDGPCGNTAMALDCDGGTIKNIQNGDAITLNNTGGRVKFQNMIIEDISDTNDATAAIQTRSGRDAIHGANVNGGLAIESSIIRRTSDNGIHGRAFSGGPTTNFNGLEILNSLLENAGRFHVTGRGDNGSQAEGLVTILGMTGTVRINNSRFTAGGHALSFVSPNGTGTLDMTVQRSTFVDLYKEFGCPDIVPTVNVGGRGITVQLEGPHDAVIRIGDPAETNSLLGNTFTNNATASVVVNGQEGGAAPHTGDIDVVISQNTFEVNDHLTGSVGCPAGQLAFNFPQGGVSLNPAGGTYEAIVSNNLFDQVMHAAGGSGQLTISTLTGNGDSEFIVRGNEFKLPWDAAVVLRAETNNSAAILFDGNTYTDGVVGGATDDIGSSTQSPFQGFLVNVRNSGHMDLTVQNEILPQQDDINGGGAFSFIAETQDQASNTLNLYVDNTKSPDSYQFIQTNGTFNLFRENVTDTTAAAIIDGNGNTGGNGMSGVPNPAVNGDNTDPPVVSTTGTITPTDIAPTLPNITF